MVEKNREHVSHTILLLSDGPFLEGVAGQLSGEYTSLEVITAPSSSEAPDLLENSDVDCAVIDTASTNGTAVATRLRADHPDLPLVLRLDGHNPAEVPDIATEKRTDVIWWDGDDDSLDELVARVGGVVSSAQAGGEEAQHVADQTDKIETLHDAATDIVTSHTAADVYERTVQAAERILEFDLCCTMIYDDGMLRPKAISSEAPPDGARPMEPDEGEAGYVFQTGEARITDDSQDDDISSPAKAVYRSGLSVPIGERGVFQAVSTEPGAFSKQDYELVELLVSHTEAALDRIRLDERLQRERDRFRGLIEYSSDIVTVLGDDGTIEYQSPSIERILGYDKDELTGDVAFEYVHPDDREKVFERFLQVVENPEEVLSVEYRFRDADGDWRILESIGTNHLDDPTIEGIVANSRDITERKEQLQILEELPTAAGQLQDAETMEDVADITIDMMRSVLDLKITGLWLYEPEHNALEPAASTAAAQDLFGDLPTFTPADDSLSWEVFETGDVRIYDDLHEVDEVYNPETVVRTEILLPLGAYGVINIGSTEREQFSDVDLYFARILAAMTEFALGRLDHEDSLEQQQEELRRQNERLNKFAATVSHDLRNPLNVASLRIDLSRQERDLENLEVAADALERMETLIDEILSLAREGQAIKETEPVDLSAVATTAWKGIETNDTDLKTVGDFSFLADEHRLREVLENLIYNACEHGNADTVRIGPLQTHGDKPGFYLEDDGSGIPREHRDQVFETGFSTATKGTGFGLAIVEEIVQAHGWSISLTESSSDGARFEVRGVQPA